MSKLSPFSQQVLAIGVNVSSVPVCAATFIDGIYELRKQQFISIDNA